MTESNARALTVFLVVTAACTLGPALFSFALGKPFRIPLGSVVRGALIGLAAGYLREGFFEVFADETGGRERLMKRSLAGALVLGVLGWWLFVPSEGKPVPAGAFRHAVCGFAVSPIPGWEVSESPVGSDCLGARLLKDAAVRQVLTLKPSPRGPGAAPLAGVVVVPWEIPRINEAGKNAILRVAVSDLSKKFDGFWLQSESFVDVDNLRAVKLLGTGRMNPVRRRSAKVETLDRRAITKEDIVPGYDVKVAALVVPGRQRGYVVQVMCPAQAFAEQAKAIDDFFASFRVTERPLNYSHEIKEWVDEIIWP